MKYRSLGQSGLEASVVGFGAWAIGGWTWGGSDPEQSIRAIHAFLDAGGNLIDTAPVYGFGASEEVVGKAIAGRRDQVILATKCSMRWDLSEAELTRASHKFSTTGENIDWSGERNDKSFDVYIYTGADGIRKEVEASLKRLGTDYLDLYQTHWQDDQVPIEEKMGALETLKQEGKIRAIGVSNASVPIIQQYQQYGQVDTDQEKFSMLDRKMESENLPYCQQQKIGFLAYSPLAQGLLTGKITADRTYDEGDQRNFKARFRPDNVEKVQAMLRPMIPIAEKHQVTLAQLVTAWTLAQPGCSHVLCGARDPQQAAENAAAGDLVLSQNELLTIQNAVQGYDGE